MAWFLELPLWIEEPAFRVVHACWDLKSANVLEPFLRTGRRLTSDLVHQAHMKDSPVAKAVDVLLKGPEVELPAGASFTDKDGHVRTAIRTRWWDPNLTTFESAYIGPDGVEIPDLPLPSTDQIQIPERLTFIGHYWLDPRLAPQALSERVVCVDYSVAKGGPLCAYRHDGESVIDSRRFCVRVKRDQLAELLQSPS